MIIFWEKKDIDSTIREFNTQIDSIYAASTDVMASVLYNKIEKMARQELRTTYKPFIMGIDMIVENGSIKFELDDLAEKIETGFAQRDLRHLLNGPSAKTTKDGDKYIDIPFRAATPSANLRGANFASQLERHSYDAIRAVGRLTDSDTDGVLRSNQLTGYVHQRHIHSGLTQYSNPNGRGSVYMSFRRLSENSDPASFIIKPVVGNFIIKRAIEELNIQEIESRLKG